MDARRLAGTRAEAELEAPSWKRSRWERRRLRERPSWRLVMAPTQNHLVCAAIAGCPGPPAPQFPRLLLNGGYCIGISAGALPVDARRVPRQFLPHVPHGYFRLLHPNLLIPGRRKQISLEHASHYVAA